MLALIACDHFFSHFYFLVLPPLFPLLTDVYGVGYTELGIGLMAMSLGNTLTAAPVGVLVDRFGARTPLIGGLALAGLCYILIPLFPTYGALVVFMTLIGVANSVFHPANYAILDAVIPGAKMGRAFSVHSFGGYLGTAAAPATVIFLEAYSDWQTALVVSGAAGVIMAGVLLAFARHIPDVHQSARRRGEESAERRPRRHAGVVQRAGVARARVLCRARVCRDRDQRLRRIEHSPRLLGTPSPRPPSP